MLIALRKFFDRRSPIQVSVMAFAMVCMIAIADYLTTDKVSISICYLAPIALEAWYAPAWAALVICGLATLAWFDVEYLFGHRDSYSLITVWNGLVRFAFFLTTALLVAQTRVLMLRLQKLAKNDGLTGLLNASSFRATADTLVQLANRHRHPLAIGFLDVDDFKAVNDSLGHAEGDRVLSEVAATLARTVRGSDLVGRLGGDEFAILMPETDPAGAKASFRRIRQALMLDAAVHEWHVSFSIGVALFPNAGTDIGTALRIADQLTYDVKHHGRDGIAIREYPGGEHAFGSALLAHSAAANSDTGANDKGTDDLDPPTRSIRARAR